MLDAIVGGLIGSGIALIGTFITTRDTRWGRISASEERAAATLLAQLRRVRQEPELLKTWRGRTDFTEECLTAIFAFRDRRVRARLTTSVDMLVQCANLSESHGYEYEVEKVQHLAFSDIRQCLEARLDRKRLPKPEDRWVEAAPPNLADYLAKWEAVASEAELAAEADQEETRYRDALFYDAVELRRL
jgi:hypothetical protein